MPITPADIPLRRQDHLFHAGHLDPAGRRGESHEGDCLIVFFSLFFYRRGEDSTSLPVEEAVDDIRPDPSHRSRRHPGHP